MCSKMQKRKTIINYVLERKIERVFPNILMYQIKPQENLNQIITEITQNIRMILNAFKCFCYSQHKIKHKIKNIKYRQMKKLVLINIFLCYFMFFVCTKEFNINVTFFLYIFRWFLVVLVILEQVLKIWFYFSFLYAVLCCEK